jgi:glycosyltransferase involved in cell wall biosynthesis
MDKSSQLNDKFSQVENGHRRLKLIFVARKFGNMAGGLERISIDLMNEMVRRGHRVSLMTWDESGAVAHYPIDAGIEWLKLDIGNSDISTGVSERFARLKRFRSFAKKIQPDVILGFQSGAALFSRLAVFGLKIKILAAERVSPDMWKHVRKGLRYRFLDIYSLGLANQITVQFPDYIQKYPRIFHYKMVSIPNPVQHKNIHVYTSSSNEKIILYVARFCYQKNHELLISAFAQLSHIFKDWKLVLAGDGDYEDRIRALVDRLGLNNRVEFCGAVKDVDSLYRQSDLVAFPSFFEGFPNALAEALAFGIPCVGLNSTLGVNSLVKHKVNGLLVDPTPEAFASGLATLMKDEQTRREMSVEARKISCKYTPQNSYQLWETLLQRMAK